MVIRQRCWELFGVCSKLSKVMFVSGSLKLIRTSSRGSWGCALCTPKRSLSLDFSLPNKTLEWPWDEHKPTPSHILHLRRNHFWQPTWLGFLTLYFTMLTLRNTVTASSKYLECRERKRSWKRNGFDPLEQPLRLGSIGGQSCNSCKSWCGHLGKIHQSTDQPTN